MLKESLFLFFLMLISSVVISIALFIAECIKRRPRRCPQTRICKDAKCKKRARCKKYKKNSEKIINIHEIQKEKKKRAKRR